MSLPVGACCSAFVAGDGDAAFVGIGVANELPGGSTTSKDQPSYNMDRFLATTARDAPFVAGHGSRHRSKALNNELDATLSQLEAADRARSGH
jgi:hypothetical protein